MTSLVNALNAVVNVRVLVMIVVVRPNRAHAPTGNGDRTSPAMVETKIDKSCHACGVTSTGFGIANRINKPMAIERVKGRIFAPCDWGVLGSVIEVTVVDAEMGLRGFVFGLKMEGLMEVLKNRAVDGGDRRRRGKLGFFVAEACGGDLGRRRDRRWREGGRRAVEKTAEDSIGDGGCSRESERKVRR
ncbi:hypothetical protein E3N88_42232 [Mikania micrantha]|uniref:Uncharacterized protein n=1 Tax=Mikania micrantha TaxID=192012 RepID=A0A5N6LJ90_9ASTR|nr:hypothetical protein E3N88_42232 [Mikania micrantha]